MGLRGIDDLLKTLGYIRENAEMWTLRDESIGDFFEGEPAVDYRRRLLTARLTSQADYEKELELVKIHKQQRAEKARKEA
jgi:hypothetical protein